MTWQLIRRRVTFGSRILVSFPLCVYYWPEIESQKADISDLDYSWIQYLTDTPPQLPPASYRYNATSGAVFLVDDTVTQPNGIAFSPDGSTLYISDSGMCFLVVQTILREGVHG